MSRINILYMGTPEFAADILKILAAEHNVVAVITQQDKPQGRKMTLTPPAVKVVAQELSIPVYQPETLKDGAILDILNEYKPDLIAVAAYGKILPEYVLNFPPMGCINVHGSLLPKYRGAGPVQWAIINGEEKTGITIMHMAKGLDTGDMILSVPVEIGEYEPYGELKARMAPIGANALLEAIAQIQEGTAKRIPQDDSQSTYAPMLDKEIARIDFSKSAREIKNLIYGLNPWPVAYAYYEGKKMKIYTATIGEETTADAGRLFATRQGLCVACGDGFLLNLREIQLEGGKRMDSKAFLLGHTIDENSCLTAQN